MEYKILRFRFDKPTETIATGLTKKEAQEHCQREDTRGIDKDGTKWFDGYTEE